MEFTTNKNDLIMEVKKIVESIRVTSSTNGKIEILKQNKENEGLKEVLEMTYNPHKKYGISIEMLADLELAPVNQYDNLKTLTNTLATNNINNKLRSDVKRFLMDSDKEIRGFYVNILTKDLKIGVNAQTINKVWKGLIPMSETGVTIKPMLASKFDFEKTPKDMFAVTEKLDGIRCLAVCKKEKIELYTRQGKLIEGCIKIEEELKNMRSKFGADFVLDGELLATNCDYSTVYKETIKRVKNKNEIKTGIYYMVFDILNIKEFEELKGETPYIYRLDILSNVCKNIKNKNVVKMITTLYVGHDTNRILELLDECKELGAEGLMVNLLDSVYEFKRSKAILKVKVMQTADLRIVGFEEGQGKHKGKLGAILVEYKNNIVRVGSGFSDVEREFIWDNQQDYINRIAEVQYFEETKNKEGGLSLRFPVWKHIREDKTEPSYN